MALKIEKIIDKNKARLNMMLTPVYKLKIDFLIEELKVSRVGLAMRLIDVVLVNDADAVATIRKSITQRIKAGVGQSYMLQLKMLHTVLTIFLKRTGYLN